MERGIERGDRWSGRGRAAAAALALAAVVAIALGLRTVVSPPIDYKVWVLAPPPDVAAAGDGRCVVLLHGLARTSRSMRPMAEAIAARCPHGSARCASTSR